MEKHIVYIAQWNLHSKNTHRWMDGWMFRNGLYIPHLHAYMFLFFISAFRCIKTGSWSLMSKTSMNMYSMLITSQKNLTLTTLQREKEYKKTVAKYLKLGLKIIIREWAAFLAVSLWGACLFQTPTDLSPAEMNCNKRANSTNTHCIYKIFWLPSSCRLS